MKTMLHILLLLMTTGLVSARAAGSAETPQISDWPQTRGPNRDGIAVNCPKLLDSWPKEGPPLLWKSDWIPGCEEGGCSSPIVADGKVFVYANAKLPLEPGKPYRLITPDVLLDCGWLPGLPDDLAKKIEAAWAAKERPASGYPWWEAGSAKKEGDAEAFLAKKPELEKFIKDFIASLSLNAEDAKKYGAFITRRLCIDKPLNKWGLPNGLSWDSLTKLNAMQDARHPYYREWLRTLEKMGCNDWNVSNIWCRAFTWSDTVVCLDAATGKEIWRKEVPIDAKSLPKDPGVQWWCFTPGGGNSVQPIGGCSTPAVSGGKCFVAGLLGLYCYSTKDGTLLWQVKGDPEHASPLVVNNLVYQVGCAYDVESGKLRWKNPFWDGKHKKYEWTARYSSPLLMNADNKNYLITCDFHEETNSSFVCLDPQSGKSLWTVKSPIGGLTNARGDILIAPPNYGGSGTVAYKLTPTGAEKLWKKSLPGGAGHIYQDHLYLPSGVFTCVDVKSGDFNWKKSIPGGVCECSATALADGKIFAPLGEAHQLTKNFGDLTYALAMIKATPEKYTELGRFNPKMCMMTSPAIAGGRLYLRTLDGISCYDLQDHGVYLDSVSAKKEELTFHFKQTGGGLAAKDASGIVITEASGSAKPARTRIEGDDVVVDIKDAALPFSISCAGANALAGKNGLPAPAFSWNDARVLKFRKCFDNTIMLSSDLFLQQDGRWNKLDAFEIGGAKVTRIDLDPEGKGVSLITDKTWKAGDAISLSYPCFSVEQGEPRREKLSATVSEPQRAAAKFIKVDETTSGTWKGVYGTEGSVIAADNNASAAPKCAMVAVVNKTDAIPWAPNAADTRYLQKSGDAKDRTVTSWHAPEQFDVNIEITDGKEHQVALYCMAWGPKCDLTVDVLDADTKAVLHTQVVKDFVKGKYLIWNMKGQVIIRISSNIQEEGTATLASGLFIDPAKP